MSNAISFLSLALYSSVMGKFDRRNAFLSSVKMRLEGNVFRNRAINSLSHKLFDKGL